MSKEVYTIKAEPREVLKKKVKQLRKAGLIPAAIYGYKGTLNVQLDLKEFTKLYASASHTGIVDVVVDGKKHTIIIDEVQFNVVTGYYTHVSLRELRMDEEITAEIPLELSGADESPAVKDETSLVILSTQSIELKGLPRALPQEIVIDVSGFHAGDTIILKDIKLPEGVELVIGEDEEMLEMVIVTTASAVQEEIIEDVDSATAVVVAGVEGADAEGKDGAEDAEKKDDK